MVLETLDFRTAGIPICPRNHLVGMEYKRAKPKSARSTTLLHGRATEKVFWWCCSQVEKGFGSSLVPHRYFDEQLDSTESDISIDFDAICKWIEDIVE